MYIDQCILVYTKYFSRFLLTGPTSITAFASNGWLAVRKQPTINMVS